MNILEISRWVSVIADIVTISGILLTLSIFFTNRKKIWRSKLTEKQLDYLLELYSKLNYIFTNSNNVKYWANNIKLLNRSLQQFESEQPLDYQKMKFLQNNYIEINIEFLIGHNILIPKEFDVKLVEDYLNKTKKFEPFSFNSFALMDDEDMIFFLKSTINLMNELQKSIKKL
jgi:hypothetical protein